jgi:hypothetical protein
MDPTPVQLTFQQYSGLIAEIRNSSAAYSMSMSQIVSFFVGALAAAAFVMAATRGMRG